MSFLRNFAQRFDALFATVAVPGESGGVAKSVVTDDVAGLVGLVDGHVSRRPGMGSIPSCWTRD